MKNIKILENIERLEDYVMFETERDFLEYAMEEVEVMGLNSLDEYLEIAEVYLYNGKYVICTEC